MVVAASRNHLYRRRLQVVIDAGPRNHLYLLGQQVKIRSCPRNQFPGQMIDLLCRIPWAFLLHGVRAERFRLRQGIGTWLKELISAVWRFGSI